VLPAGGHGLKSARTSEVRYLTEKLSEPIKQNWLTDFPHFIETKVQCRVHKSLSLDLTSIQLL
jgi:hypothetical protein